MEHDELVRLYGPWRGRKPADAAELLRDYPGGWWIAGGWAIEAFTGVPRAHGDIDPGIPRSEVPLLRAHLRGRLDVWAADRGTLTPLVEQSTPIPHSCGNLWLRAGGADPWEYDVTLLDVDDGRWTYKRNASISRPLEHILWESDGLRYLRPEVQLLHKAPGLRPKDQQDFDACRPLLDQAAALWLVSALKTAHPGHPWIALLR
ncbi:MAG TPA: hypothetical protein VIL55_00280 [Naasia sp.]